jgi:hypothetical protein
MVWDSSHFRRCGCVETTDSPYRTSAFGPHFDERLLNRLALDHEAELWTER